MASRRPTAKPSAWDQSARSIPRRSVHPAAPCSLLPAPSSRRGFTLIELLVVMSILAVLTVMTIGAFSLSVTSERVRGAARQIQSKIEGARDRAIYNSNRDPDNPQPVGVRLLVDQNDPSVCTSLVYIQTPGNDESQPAGATTSLTSYVQAANADILANNGVPAVKQRALIGTGVSWSTLYDRGLIGPGSTIRLGRAGGTGEVFDTIHPGSFPIQTEGAHSLGDANGDGDTNDPVLFTIQLHPDVPTGVGGTAATVPLSFSLPLNPDVMTEEDALQLPRGTCIDLETSHLPDGWVTYVTDSSGNTTAQFSNRMDILFSAKGTVVGDAAAAGIIHLHVVDLADAIENVLPGSPTAGDLDGDGTPDARNGDELGITIFTKSGRTITHPLAFGGYPVAYANLGPPYTAAGYWHPNTNYSQNTIVAPRIYNGLLFKAIRFTGGSAGSSGVNEPDWNLAPGGLTPDNAVIWQSIKHDVWELALEGEVAK
ncbi:MAG: Tfp pilus assembly protein FimT/FimU [Planctomycetaceae bacterium]